MTRRHRSRRGYRAAFTLIELLVVLAIIGILASLLLPALSRGKASAHRTACANNLRQLAFAMRMYLDDYAETFPTASAFTSQEPEDWIHWLPIAAPAITKPPRPEDLYRAGIVWYLGPFSTNLFSCPADRVFPRYRRKPQAFSERVRMYQKFPFSYTLSSPFEEVGYLSHGMASTIVGRNYTRDGQVTYYQFRLVRATQVVDPANKIMFADEAPVWEQTGTEPLVPTGYSSGWAWTRKFYGKREMLTSRHCGKGVVAFADCHVAAVPPAFAEEPAHYDPLY